MFPFRIIFVTLAKFSTRIYIFESENYDFKIHVYNVC